MQQPTARQIEADTLAYQHKLGSLRKIYELNGGSCCSFFFVPIILSLFVILPLWIAIPMLRAQMPLSLSMSLIAPVFLLVFAGAGLSIVIKIAMGWIIGIRKRGSALLLYTNGLIVLQYQHKQLVFSDALHWQDVDLVWHKIYRVQRGEDSIDVVHNYSIQNKQGAMFGGDSFEFNRRKLGYTVEQETLPYLWPATLDSYQRGSLVTFGAISISSSGISYNGQLLPWQEVKNVRSNDKGIITIKQHSAGILSSWAKVSDNDVPNIHLLYMLLAFIRDQQGPTAFSIENKR